MVILIVVVAVIAAVVLVAGAVYFLMRVMRQKEVSRPEPLPAKRRLPVGEDG